NESCKAVCNTTFDIPSSQFVSRIIWWGYNLNWLIDGLPAAQVNSDWQTGTTFYSPGFPLGSDGEDGLPVLNNHYDIMIEYHPVRGLGKTKYRVVGVVVVPYSRNDSKIEDRSVDCGEGGPPLKLGEDDQALQTPVTWTYSVIWTESPTAW